MYQLITIFKLLCVATITSATQLEPRIAKGNYAGRGQFPTIVAIRQINDNAHICTGIIVDRFWALTTAHCFYEKGGRQQQNIVLVSNTLTTNSSEGKNHYITGLKIHKNFDPNNNRDDLLLIKVREEFFSERSPLAATVEKTLNQFGDVDVGDVVIAAGWGREYEDSIEFSSRLKYTTLKTVDSKNEICYNNDHTFCAKALDGGATCLGDCGGPVLDRTGQKLVGVIPHKKGCTPGEVEQVIRIEPYKNWIWDVTDNFFTAISYDIKNILG